MPNLPFRPFIAVALPLLCAVPSLAQWTLSANGLPNTQGLYHGLNQVIKGGSALYASGNNSLHRSTDNGANWTDIYTGLPAGARITGMAATPSRLFVAYYTSSPTTGGFHYSTNGGTSWTNTNITVSNNYISGLDVSGDTVVAYAGTPALYRSTNGGTNWTTVATTPPTQSGNVALLRGVLYLSGDNGLHRSTNLGDSWTQVTAEDGYTLAASGSALYYGGRPQLRRSIDNGLTWDVHGTGFPANADMSSLVAKDSILVAPIYRANYSAGVYISTDNGATWRAFNEGLAANAKITSIVEKDGVLYGTAAGVFKRNLAEATTGLAFRAPAARAARANLIGRDRLRLAVPGFAGPLAVRLTSASGRTARTAVFPSGLREGALLDVSDLPAGLYSATLSGAGFQERLAILLP